MYVLCVLTRVCKYFCSVGIGYITTLVSDNEFWSLLRKRPESSTEAISDIYDGAEYSRLSRSGSFLCRRTNPANISFTFNTDGVSLFRSSQTGIWPILLVINELPPAAR